jgi:hypothetical protein
MSLRSRLAAITAAAAILAIPVTTAGAATAAGSTPTCSSVSDPGPFGPAGPYGPDGPYGPRGPLYGKPNPLGDAAQCGGLSTYLMRGGTISSYVNANLASVGIMPTTGG